MSQPPTPLRSPLLLQESLPGMVAADRSPSQPRPSLFERLLGRRRATSVPFRATRSQIKPPAVWGQAEPVWTTLWTWLRSSEAAAERPLRILDAARHDFCVGLEGLRTHAAEDLQRRAEHARSLRELWHLRAELYSLVARQMNQGEADRRLSLVNRHFPSGAKPIAPAHASSRLPHDHLA